MREKKLILVAENKSIDAAYMQLMFQRNGWEAEVAKDGKEVLEKIKHHDYSLLVINSNLQDMDGLETAQKIREEEKASNKHIPIIGTTGTTLEREKKRFIKAVVDYCLSKPVYKNHLFDVIKNIFNENRLQVTA